MLNCPRLTALQSSFVCKKSFLGPFPAFSESLVMYLTLMVCILNIKLMNRNYNKLSYWIVFRECFSSLPRVSDGGDLYPVPLAQAGWSQAEADGQCRAGPSASACGVWKADVWETPLQGGAQGCSRFLSLLVRGEDGCLCVNSLFISWQLQNCVLNEISSKKSVCLNF